MKQIQPFSIERLRMEEDFGFQIKVKAKTSLLILESDKQMVADYEAALLAFDLVLKQNIANSHTAAVKAADEKADAAWRGLRTQAKAMLNYPVEENHVIATRAMASINKYGDITNLAYSEEYGRMHNLLQELDALTVESQKVISIDLWVAELHIYYDEYMAAVDAQSKEGGAHITGATVEKRSDADAAFHALALRVNALAVVNGEVAYSEFIDDVNFYIDREHKNLASRKPNPDAPIVDDATSASRTGV